MSQIQCYTITMNTNTEYDPLPPGLFVWMDLEYTTTDVATARILEVAAIITNRQLKQIGEPFSLTCKPDDFSKHSMPKSVVDMQYDREVLAKRMPALYERLGFRQLDVRCAEEMADT